MNIDRERQSHLEREKALAEAELSRLEAAGDAPDAVRECRERVRRIDDELRRMEFATELERQSDA